MAFSISRLPQIVFGPGTLRKLPELLAPYGQRLLLVTGAQSLKNSPSWGPLAKSLSSAGLHWDTLEIRHEPSPADIDQAVAAWRDTKIDAVVGIGGGSVLDAAKAIAGLLIPGNSVMDHLEGVGPELPYRGPAVPFIAVPTTAGTGSEATKNAVLSRQGPDGFKKSFRDEKLTAQLAIIDPDLLASCPPAQIAANGMDAFTQLLESYVSIRSNPVTDALAITGMKAAIGSLVDWYRFRTEATQARENMALASLLSGICLAQAGLGSVHGLAQPLGCFFPIPHGVVCGTLVAAATRTNIEVMRSRDPTNAALEKYTDVGRLCASAKGSDADDPLEALVRTLEDWTRQLELPALSSLGVQEHDIPRIVANSRGSSMKTNPVVLSDDEIGGIIAARLR